MGTDCANKAGMTERYIAWIANSAPRPSIPYMLAKVNGEGRHAWIVDGRALDIVPLVSCGKA